MLGDDQTGQVSPMVTSTQDVASNQHEQPATASAMEPAQKKPRVATSDGSTYPDWTSGEYIWEILSQIFAKVSTAEFRQAQNSTQATDSLRFADAFASGGQWMITKDQIADLVRIASHQASPSIKLQSYGQLKAYCDLRRGQAEVIRKFYQIPSHSQDVIGWLAFQHPSIRQLVREQCQFNDDQLDKVLGKVRCGKYTRNDDCLETFNPEPCFTFGTLPNTDSTLFGLSSGPAGPEQSPTRVESVFGRAPRVSRVRG